LLLRVENVCISETSQQQTKFNRRAYNKTVAQGIDTHLHTPVRARYITMGLLTERFHILHILAVM